MSNDEKIQQIKDVVEEWLNKQGHERCWYYPDLFQKIADILEIEAKPPQLPSRKEFEHGCAKYQDEQYGKQNTGNVPNLVLACLVIAQVVGFIYIVFFM